MGVYQFMGGVKGQVTKEELHVNKASLPPSILMLRFASIIILLERGTNKHYHQDLDRHSKKLLLPNTKNSEMFLSLAKITQTGHDIHPQHTNTIFQ